MSDALERVIAEQQAKIDVLTSQLALSRGYGTRLQDKLEEMCYSLHSVLEWPGLYECWRSDKAKEWASYREERDAACEKLKAAGWCFSCATLRCDGECCND